MVNPIFKRPKKAHQPSYSYPSYSKQTLTSVQTPVNSDSESDDPWSPEGRLAHLQQQSQIFKRTKKKPIKKKTKEMAAKKKEKIESEKETAMEKKIEYEYAEPIRIEIEDNSSLSEISGSPGDSGDEDSSSASWNYSLAVIQNNGSVSTDPDQDIESSIDSNLELEENWNSDGEYIGPEPKSRIWPAPKKLKKKKNKGLRRVYQNTKTHEIVEVEWSSEMDQYLQNPKKFKDRFVYDENGKLIKEPIWYVYPYPEKSDDYERIDIPPGTSKYHQSSPRYHTSNYNYNHTNSDYRCGYQNNILSYRNPNYGTNYYHYEDDSDEYKCMCCGFLFNLILIAVFLYFLLSLILDDEPRGHGDNRWSGVGITGLFLCVSCLCLFCNLYSTCTDQGKRGNLFQAWGHWCQIVVRKIIRFFTKIGPCCLKLGLITFYFGMISMEVVFFLLFLKSDNSDYFSLKTGTYLIVTIFAAMGFLLMNVALGIKYIPRFLNSNWRTRRKESVKEYFSGCFKCCCPEMC